MSLNMMNEKALNPREERRKKILTAMIIFGTTVTVTHEFIKKFEIDSLLKDEEMQKMNNLYFDCSVMAKKENLPDENFRSSCLMFKKNIIIDGPDSFNKSIKGLKETFVAFCVNIINEIKASETGYNDKAKKLEEMVDFFGVLSTKTGILFD